MTPAHRHISFALLFKIGILPSITVGAPTTQGAGVLGMHGIGVSTPIAAAVAAATVNMDGLMWLGIFVGIVALVTVFSRVVGANLVGAVRGADQVHFH